MSVETLDDIVEEIADLIGVYGAKRRCQFVSDLRSRILLAIDIEQRLSDTIFHERMVNILKEVIQNEQSDSK